MGRSVKSTQNINMSAPAAAAAPKAKVAAAHPPYATMIAAAIKGLGDKKGSSRQAIIKYVVANNKVDAAKAAVRVRLAVKKIIAAAAAGKKGAGSFKLPVAAKKPKAKKVKKPAAKKAKKPKKAAKKPAAKKAAKPKAKKPAAKKVAKKAAPKKK